VLIAGGRCCAVLSYVVVTVQVHEIKELLRGHGGSVRPYRRASLMTTRAYPYTSICIPISVGSVYANQKGKSDQTSLVPILNIWVIIVGG
jgi:hypothetical protein